MSSGKFYFVTDLHGRKEKYSKLLQLLSTDPPRILLIGGDILPRVNAVDFIHGYLYPELLNLKKELHERWPWICIILGNDDPKSMEPDILQGETLGLWKYIHCRELNVGPWRIFGYSCIPPTPFMLKDWERYDVSRYTDPGSIPPEEGFLSVKTTENICFATIWDDLAGLTLGRKFQRTIFLFHSPPHSTHLDRLGGAPRIVDHAPVDMHVGSIAIRRMIEEKQPLLTLHGHIHEAVRITGSWIDKIGKTYCFSAAHDGPELAVVIFLPDKLDQAERILI